MSKGRATAPRVRPARPVTKWSPFERNEHVKDPSKFEVQKVVSAVFMPDRVTEIKQEPLYVTVVGHMRDGLGHNRAWRRSNRVAS